MNTILWAMLAFIGYPLFALHARFRPQRDRKKILLVQWAKLGDLVCTTPMFRAIKQVHPEWEVHVLCRKRCGEAVMNNPFVDRIFAHDGTRGEMVKAIRSERYDVIVNCMPDGFASLLGILGVAPVRINTFSSERGLLVRSSTLLNTVNIEYRHAGHLAQADRPERPLTFDHYMRLLQPLGVPPVPYKLDFFPSPDDERMAEAWMKEHRLAHRSFVCLNISAGNAIKEWPLDKCAAFADRAIAEMNLSVVLSTLDRKRVEEVRSLMRHENRAIDGSTLSLGQLGAVARHAAAYIAVDTGPMFVAYASGAPVVVLVGGSDPREQIPPAGDRVAHVLPPEGCEPWVFVSLTPRQGTPEQLSCIRETSVKDVMEGLARLPPGRTIAA
ncbi:MAG: glycosyl transferase, family 9 [Candidatus Peregrinibacteria bacterium Greene0416_19]|nr:MAG: glycosyl transferase, family 9 [Candidatus Peregrinibacteria bacterium Greene0416_19]